MGDDNRNYGDGYMRGKQAQKDRERLKVANWVDDAIQGKPFVRRGFLFPYEQSKLYRQ